jgi:hypothetical protein
MRLVRIALLLLAIPLFIAASSVSDASVKQMMIRDSIASYPSVCACPYSVMRNGRARGGRSAYSRPGGYAPICYDRDITPEMLRQYRVDHGL